MLASHQSLRTFCNRWAIVLSAALTPTMAFSQSCADQQQDNASVATVVCDTERARATAIKLFEFAERRFDRVRNAKPLEVKILEEHWEEDPPTFVHEARFATFAATFYLENGGKRRLQSLTASAPAFKLPEGLKWGQSLTQVLRVLGPPSAVNEDSALYQIIGEAYDEVFFTFQRDRLVRVAWVYGRAD